MTSEGDISDILSDRERILMVAWALPNDGPLTPSMREQAMSNFVAYIRRTGMTAADVARQIGRPKATTITELTKSVYRANTDAHIRKLNMFIEQHARAKAASLTRGFIATTKVAKDMMTVARLVRENGTMGMVMGPTGIGKSRCAMAIHERYVGSVYLSIMYGCQSPKGFASVLAGKLGVRFSKNCDRLQLFTTTLERVVDALRNSHRLIIIDEASKLKEPAVELCREIHDHTGVPFLLIATRDLHDRIVRNADPDHGQLYSRFDVILHLTEGYDAKSGGKLLHTVEDIRKLYNDPPIRLADDAVRYLQDVANDLGRGSLRRCETLVPNAARRSRKRQDLAEHHKVTVTAADLDWVERRLRRESSEQQAVQDRRHRQRSAAVGG